MTYCVSHRAFVCSEAPDVWPGGFNVTTDSKLIVLHPEHALSLFFFLLFTCTLYILYSNSIETDRITHVLINLF